MVCVATSTAGVAATAQAPARTPADRAAQASGKSPGGPGRRDPATGNEANPSTVPWLSISLDDRKNSRNIRAHLPLSIDPPLEGILSSELRAELRRARIDLDKQVQALKNRPAGDRLELFRGRLQSGELRLTLELRAPGAGPTVTQLSVQLRSPREPSKQGQVLLPIDASRATPSVLRELELRGERPFQDLEQLVELSRLVVEAARYEPQELVVIEQAGRRVVLATRP